jgi:hypothetical protein
MTYLEEFPELLLPISGEQERKSYFVKNAKSVIAATRTDLLKLP